MKRSRTEASKGLSVLGLGAAMLIALLGSAASIAFLRGGLLHPESGGHILTYLSDQKPLAAKIFDIRSNDPAGYPGRELSFLFDYLDARFLQFCIRQGAPHFLSLTHYWFCTLIGLAIWDFTAGSLGLGWAAAAALTALFWSSPDVVLSGFYFRSAKVGVALTLSVLLCLLSRRAGRGRAGAAECAAVGALAFLMSVFDKQGVMLLILLTTLWSARGRDDPERRVEAVLIGAFLANMIYTYALGPLLTRALNGYWPDFSFLAFPWDDCLERGGEVLSNGAALFVDTVRFSLGCVPRAAAAALAAGAVALLAFRRGAGRRLRRPFPDWVLLAVGAAGLVVMDGLMWAKHPPLAWPDVRRGFYWIPATVLIVFAVAALVKELDGMSRSAGVAARWVLAAAVAANVAALPGHYRFLAAGHLRPRILSTPALIDALARLDEPGFVPTADVAASDVYRFFAAGRGR